MKNLDRINEYKNVQCIYRILNDKTGKAYIGSTTNLKDRMRSHINKLEKKSHINKELQKDWNIFEPKNFSFDMLELIEEKSKLPIKEKEYIDKHKQQNGVYNKSDPTEEFWQGRYKTKRKGVKNKVTKSYIKGYLDAKFYDRIQPVKDRLKFELFVDDEDLSIVVMKDVTNQDILDHTDLKGIINNWLRDNELGMVYFPNFKKEFRQLYGKIVNEEKIYYMSLTNYDELLNKRKNNMRNLISLQEESKEIRAERKKSKKKKTTKDNSKVKQPKSNLNKEEKAALKEEYNTVLLTEFDYLFTALTEKIQTGAIVSYQKVFNHIINKINIHNVKETYLI